jgi:serine protease
MRFLLLIISITAVSIFPSSAWGDAIDNPNLSQQWWLEGSINWSDYRNQSFVSEGVDAVSVWPRTEGEGVVVADIDSGAEATHPDLVGALLPQINFAGGKGDTVGHGTHVAGIIAGRGEDGLPAGVAPQAKVLPLNIHGNSSPSAASHIDPNALIKAIRYAGSREDVKIINMSLGGDYNDPNLAAAVHFALRHGKVIVAAGNTGTNNETELHTFPCNYHGVICVAAIDRRDELTWWSNYSPDRVILAAPGDEINSTFLHSSYYVAKGTSMAAPMVSGVAALLWAAHPEASAHQIIKAIVLGVKFNASLNGYVMTAGTVNAPASLAILDSMLTPSP